MSWVRDDCGDLINLAHMEYISLSKLEPEQIDELPAHNERGYITHEVLAVSPREISFRLFIGTEDQCKSFIKSLEMRFDL